MNGSQIGLLVVALDDVGQEHGQSQVVQNIEQVNVRLHSLEVLLALVLLASSTLMLHDGFSELVALKA